MMVKASARLWDHAAIEQCIRLIQAGFAPKGSREFAAAAKRQRPEHRHLCLCGRRASSLPDKAEASTRPGRLALPVPYWHIEATVFSKYAMNAAATVTDPPSAESSQIPEQVARDFDITEFLREEVNKSGELYLKVALWKVLLRLPQHYEDFGPANPQGKEFRKQMLVSLMADSEALIREGAAAGGLDQKRHGVTEKIIRENIQWMREKLVLLELNLTEARKKSILTAFSIGRS